jgi:hypothetical protein
MLTWIEHVGGAYIATEETRLPIGLKKMHENLRPPQVERIGGHAVREVPKQGPVRHPTFGVPSESQHCTLPKIGELVEIA